VTLPLPYLVQGGGDGAEFNCVAGGPHGGESVRSLSRRDYRAPNRPSVV